MLALEHEPTDLPEAVDKPSPSPTPRGYMRYLKREAPADPRDRPSVRLRRLSRVTFGEHIGEYVADLLDGIAKGRLPGPATRDVLARILPPVPAEEPPPPIELPLIVDFATYRAATRLINASRAQEFISTREANELLLMAKELWRACREQDQAEREAGWQRELVG